MSLIVHYIQYCPTFSYNHLSSVFQGVFKNVSFSHSFFKVYIKEESCLFYGCITYFSNMSQVFLGCFFSVSRRFKEYNVLKSYLELSKIIQNEDKLLKNVRIHQRLLIWILLFESNHFSLTCNLLQENCYLSRL